MMFHLWSFPTRLPITQMMPELRIATDEYAPLWSKLVTCSLNVQPQAESREQKGPAQWPFPTIHQALL